MSNGDQQSTEWLERIVKMEEKISNMEKRAASWVTRSELTPVKLVVYGIVGIALASILAAVVKGVLGGDT